MWFTSRTARSAAPTEPGEMIELGNALPLPDDVAEWMGMEPGGRQPDDLLVE